MDKRNGPADGGVAQAGQPAGLLRRQCLKIAANDLNEHQLAEAQADAFSARPLSGHLCQR